MLHFIFGGHYMINHYIGYYSSPIGWIEIETSEKVILSIIFVDERKPQTEQPEIMINAISQLDEYFKGVRLQFELTCEINGTEFQEKAWNQLLEIPYGKITSYYEMAKRVGNEKATRAIGNANGKNKISIVYPCHRVIGKDGSLTGYAGGVERKKWLLEHEKTIKDKQIQDNDKTNRVYAPGCALMIYKPDLADRVLNYLKNEDERVAMHLTCCRHDPVLEPGSVVINTCAGCDKRYRELYAGVSTISLWELLASSESFPFPDYKGKRMTIHDACPTRTEERVHQSIRTLLKRMNIELVEPKHTMKNAICCGDRFYDVLSVEKVKNQMRKRADEMPCEDVIVYCVSCIKAIHIGNKKPRYLVDLLFNEKTHEGIFEPNQWHALLQDFIDGH